MQAPVVAFGHGDVETSHLPRRKVGIGEVSGLLPSRFGTGASPCHALSRGLTHARIRAERGA